ncbi:60S ribosomal subunit assembly/export protein LOC1 [Microdochium trichocladiopsis]|uniref:60S ribosomal subunit assembly/export protein LOC1 n=1 Tax=Microdochium trichocladiopsis TaxID=1682393 RepID=A0A9P8Y855_9PEZI|nr:60S ribosomal subunit assembly/export protein LOC1 [Microdochium trichocladiopsis]KAH7032944.1 60S ribosomal subunit assembly/export protein LOC1 [Microdochium trichocladiopsis]
MPPSRTKTVKNKHAGAKSGISGSKSSKSSGPPDGIVRQRSSSSKGKAPTTTAKQVKGRSATSLLNKKRKKVYTEKELGLPQLNMITPIGVTKPKGKKKGKVFVDDRESMSTILALVQADKEGQIESKMIKARQMEDIREARRLEAEKKEEERKGKLDETKESLRRKRKRPSATGDAVDEFAVKDVASAGSRASKAKKKKVAFA